MTANLDRPQPLRSLIGDVAASRGLIVGVITALVSGGIISATTGDLLDSLTGLIPGALALIGTVLGAHGVATAGQALVTPVSDPAALIDGRLVPLVPASAVTPPVAPPPSSPFGP